MDYEVIDDDAGFNGLSPTLHQHMVGMWAEALRIVATKKLGRHTDATAIADAVRFYLLRIVEQETGEDPVEGVHGNCRELSAAGIIGSVLQAVTYMRFHQFDKARNVMALIPTMVNDLLTQTDRE